MNWEDPDFDLEFADPGGRSALRRATTDRCPSCKRKIGERDNYCKHCAAQLNPRKFPCPNCGVKNVLTRKDVELGYQCDRCADQVERGDY
jgi:predicted RNA-binding Zn-ribbon protein involved in translation (DUF1610 family)